MSVSRNQIILSFPDDLQQELMKASEFVLMDLHDKVYEPNEPIEHIYFPEVGVISITRAASNGRETEIFTVGNEGMVGSIVTLNVEMVSERAYVQVEGNARRVEVGIFLKLVAKYPQLRDVCMRYMAVLLDQASCNLNCNEEHSVEQRCAKWLLFTSDRNGADYFLLTQEFLAIMLGCSRTLVNATAGKFSDAGLIKYSRGKITIVDRDGLSRESCNCYKDINRYIRYAMHGEAIAKPGTETTSEQGPVVAATGSQIESNRS
jgi:CRP-like cAMP-binding protein